MIAVKTPSSMKKNKKSGLSSSDRSIKEKLFVGHELSESNGDDHGSSSDTDNSESSGNKEPSTSSMEHILHDIVSSPSDFERVTDPGQLTSSDMSEEDNEYYVFRFPPGFLNPCDLVGNKVKVKNGTSQMINLGKNSFELCVHENLSQIETPAVFVPDNSGQFFQADLKISGHITMKKVPLAHSDALQVNIDDLRTRSHQPPEIRERVFFGSPGSPKHHAKYNLETNPKLFGEKKHKSKKRKSAIENEVVSTTYAASPSHQRGHFGSEPSEEKNKLEKELRIKQEAITPLKKSNISKGFEKFSPLATSPNKKIKKE